MPDVVLSPEQVAEIRAVWRQLDARYGAQPTASEVEALCDTLEAQAEVIQRYKDGWKAFRVRHPSSASWGKDNLAPPDWKAMTEAHQLVVYGEVVAKREDPATADPG